MTLYYQKMKSPIGNLHLVADDLKLLAILFDSQWSAFKKKNKDLATKTNSVLDKTIDQLQEYFSGERKKFDLPLKLDGTDFQQQVWKSLGRISYGKTKTYQEQATLIRNPKAVRAVGRTNGLNRLCIVLPCHRVIGKSGKLTGYAGGLKAKKFLLELEGIEIQGKSL